VSDRYGKDTTDPISASQDNLKDDDLLGDDGNNEEIDVVKKHINISSENQLNEVIVRQEDDYDDDD